MAQTKVKCIDALRLFIDELKKHFPVEAVYLFGSQLRGTAKKDSDIDVIVISKYFEQMPPLDRLVLLGKIAWKAKTPEVEAIGYTAEEFDQAQPWDFPAEVRRSASSVL